jgi:hypothetical protein
VTLRHWASLPDILKDRRNFIFKGKQSKKMDVPLYLHRLLTFEDEGTTHPETQHHIPEDLNPQK